MAAEKTVCRASTPPPPRHKADGAMAAEVCENVLDSSFFNACRREMPPGPLAAVGITVATFVSPLVIVVTALAALYLLPALLVVNTDSRPRGLRASLATFERAYLGTLNFVHRGAYTLTLNVALYAVFRQHRPCRCGPRGGPYEQVGSIYGMPSGDAMSGGVFGMLLLSWVPFHDVRLSRCLGVGIMLLKCLERTALGFHSIGQVTTGTMLGVALCVYSERAPQWTIVLDSVVQLLLGLAAFSVDHEVMNVGADSGLNIFSWWAWGVGVNLLVSILALRFYARHEWRGFRCDLRSALDTITPETVALREAGAPLLSPDGRKLESLERGGAASAPAVTPSPSGSAFDDAKLSSAFLRQAADVPFMLFAFLPALAVFYAANLEQVYGWGFGG